MLDDATFLRQFEDGTFPLDDFHHREHVKIAYLYLLRYPLSAAIERIRCSLQAFAAANKVVVAPEVLDRGYHETITQAWMRLVQFTLCEYGPGKTAHEFYEAHPELWQMKSLRFFYSRDRIMSLAAKKEFVDPDLTQLPVSKKQAI